MKEWRDGIWTHYDDEGNVLHQERSDGSRIEKVEHSGESAVQTLMITGVAVGSVALAGPLGLIGVAIAWCVSRTENDEL